MNSKFFIPISLIICAFIISGGIIIVQIMKQNSIERQQLAELDLEKQKYKQEQDEKEAKDRAERDKQLQLDSCLEDAENSYSYLWDNACKAWKVQVDNEWKICRANVYSWETDAENKSRCVGITPDYNVDEYGSCLLPTSRKEEVEETIENKKEDCYQRYNNL